jgi:cytochrome P450
MTTIEAVGESLRDQVGAWLEGRGDLIADPWPMYTRMRAQTAVFEYGDLVLIPRYADVLQLLTDERLSNRKFNNDHIKSQIAQLSGAAADIAQQWADFQSNFLGATDPPDHARRRRLQMHGFFPRQLSLVKDYVQSAVDRLLDQAQERGEFDFVADIAYPIPMLVIAHMLGVPEEDMHIVLEGSKDLGYVVGRGYHHVPEVAEGLTAFKGYVEETIERRRREPKDDLLGALINAQDVEGKLSRIELTTSFFNLLFSGHETTTTALANGMLAMLQHPDQWSLLCNDLNLTDAAVEELFRFVSPVQSIMRTVPETFDYQGHVIRKGVLIRLLLSSANHDPDYFTDPDEMDIFRPREEAQHVVFGKGPHFCMGNNLSRLEMRTAFATIARRFPDVELTAETIEWNGNPLLRRVTTLPVVLNP